MVRIGFAIFWPVVAGLRRGIAALVLCAPSVWAQTPADTSGRIVGVVTAKDGGFALGYSVISAPDIGRERFSNDKGVFVLTDIPLRPVHLRIRHLGYTPLDITVNVQPGLDTVRVALTRIVVRLSPVLVRAYPECKNPGPPAVADDSSFATVFDQLKQNAEQYRLLAQTYPFTYGMTRSQSHTLVSGASRSDGVDTVFVASGPQWRYKPGGVVGRSVGVRGSSLVLNIPTIIHFADPSFLANHCFYNAGVEAVPSGDLLRVDFVAASRIRDPDVDGSIYLDPSTFQIKRSVIRLSRIPRGVSGLLETEAISDFAEAFPSIPVIVGISAINRLEANPRRPTAVATTLEEQRLIRVEFTKGMPGEDVRRP